MIAVAARDEEVLAAVAVEIEDRGARRHVLARYRDVLRRIGQKRPVHGGHARPLRRLLEERLGRRGRHPFEKDRGLKPPGSVRSRAEDRPNLAAFLEKPGRAVPAGQE